MCKIIESLNTLSKIQSKLSEKINIVTDSEIFNTSNSLITLFYLEKHLDIYKVAEITENDISFVIFNCNNLAKSGLVQNNNKKDSLQFTLTKAGHKFLEHNIEKLTYFQQFQQLFNNIDALHQQILSIDVSQFINESESEEEDINNQFVVI